MKKFKLLKLLALFVVLITSINTAWADWSDNYVTFYVAVGANHTHYDNDCRTFYSNVKRGDNNWEQITLSKTAYTYNGKTVYQGTHNFGYGGYNNWQFYIKDGSGDNQKYIEWYAGSWKSDFHNGEVWDWTGTGESDKSEDHWKTATWDDSYTVYFVNNDNWTAANVKAYAWNGNCDNNAGWAGQVMSSISKTNNGKTIYKIDLGKRYENIKFSNNGSSATSDLTLGTTNQGKMYNSGWGTLAYDVTLDRQSGTTGSTGIIATCGSAMPSTTMPTRDGYTFAGYYTSTGGSGTKYYNADGSSANTWPADGTGPTTLYAKWTQDPGVATLTAAGNATELWIGVNPSSALTFTATSSNVSSGTAVTWSLTDNTGDCTVSTTTSSYSGATFSYTPSSTGNKTITVTMTIGGNNYTKTYSLTVYERWNIYVHDVQSWGGIKVHMWDSGNTPKSTWPGDACDVYSSGNASAKWYTVTLDSKYNGGFILSKTGSDGDKTDNLDMDKSDYPSGSYWYIGSKSAGLYPLNSVSVSAPGVEITSATVISNTQIKLVGNITNCGGDGTTADDMVDVGFDIGAGSVTASCTSGTSFTKVFTGLTAGTTYTVKAYAQNVDDTGESSTQNVTTRSGSYSVKVRRGVSEGAPKIYAWTDAESCGGVKEETETFSTAPSMTALEGGTGTVYKWWEYTLSSTYNKFLICDGATDDAKNATKTADITATYENVCYWYNSSSSTAALKDRYDEMDCPITTHQLYIEEHAGAGDYEYVAMSGTTTLTKTLSLAAKSSYKFKIVYTTEYYGKTSAEVTRASAGVDDLAVDDDYITIKTDAAGDYQFDFTTAGKDLTITYPDAYTVTFGYGTGGTEVTASAPSAKEGDFDSGDYVAEGDDVTFTESHRDGYTLTGWYDAESGGSEVTGMSTSDFVLDDISADAAVYARYSENMTHVALEHNAHGHVECGGETVTSVDAGVDTHPVITAVPDAGYYFAGWTVKEGTDFTPSATGEANTTITITGGGDGEQTGQTLTASFVELEKIYFRDVFDDGESVTNWGDVYVYLGITWNGYNQAVTNSAHDDWRIHMTKIKGTDVWWAYVPRNFTTAAAGTKEKIGFASTIDNMDGRSFTFYNCNAATRGDYDKALNMFVPFHTAKTTGNNSVDYFDNGYWMKYDTRANQGAGYYLKKYNSKNDYTEEGEFIATNDDATYIQFRLRIDHANTTINYMITSAGGLNYVADNAITSANYTNVGVSENLDDLTKSDVKFSLTTTSEGDYTFILNQSGDKMKLSVDYPVSVGDYRLKHTYNDGSAKTTYSDVIKASNAAEGQTISMYLSTAGSGTLVLQKCTAIVAGQPSWNEGDATNLAGVLTTVGKNYGVYQFDVAVSADKVASAPMATKYTGPYYIKTDGAPGGWANYKQNYMDENTLNYDVEHPEKSFNYYFCKYYASDGQNIKCVIANDYCNQLSDTLIGDAVIGMANQTTPIAASVRFAYNSYTNEIMRAYLGASTSPDFLRILGNTTDGQPHIYDKDEHEYGDANDDEYITFNDMQNWRYEIEIYADINARAKLTAHFNSKTQYFIGAAGESGLEWDDENTEQLFGGASGTYGLTLVYDFKTNKLIRAWRPTSGTTISEDLTLQSDVLLLREHQEAPTAIAFGKIGSSDTYASLTKVQTVYSVLRFNRWILGNRAHADDMRSDHCETPALIEEHHPALAVNQDDTNGKWRPQAERELYFISFPYDVKMSDIIHFGGYYDTWGIMYYDGKGRAKNGYWVDSKSNWKYFTPEQFATDTLKAYVGYLIGIDLTTMAYNNTSFWKNNSCEVDIYFPSIKPVSTITQQAVTVNIDTIGYNCTINRTYGGSDGDRRIKDSHWHCIGVPAYANLTQTETHTGAPDKNTNWETDNLLYVYSWNTTTNEHAIEDAGSFTFNAMYAYLVQYSQPTLSWSAASATGPVPSPVVARRMKTEELRDRQFKLHLLQGDKEADHTFIRLSDDEAVTAGFEFNHDVSKMMLKDASLYTLIGKEQAAANSLPLDMEHTTVVPVGVKLAVDGTYTFAIPEGTEGIGVTLIDKETGARTQLGALDYTVDLTAGTYDERFALEISPIHQTPTGIDNTDDNPNDNFRKVMVDGVLYIIREGQIFDARGARVK